MNLTTVSWLVLLFGLAAPASVDAQTEKKDLFSRPSVALSCEASKTDSTDEIPGLLEFEFDEDTVDGRTITAGYRPDGTPQRLMVVSSHVASSGKLAMEIAGVGFNLNVPSVGFHAWKNSDGSSPTQPDELTPDQIAKAKELAVWLWSKRCLNVASNNINHKNANYPQPR
jgi:hypothetical protein